MVRACFHISPSLHVGTLLLGEDGLTIPASSAATVDYAPALILRCHNRTTTSKTMSSEGRTTPILGFVWLSGVGAVDG